MLMALLLLFLHISNHFDFLHPLRILPLNMLCFLVQDSNCGLSVILSNGPWKEL